VVSGSFHRNGWIDGDGICARLLPQGFNDDVIIIDINIIVDIDLLQDGSEL